MITTSNGMENTSFAFQLAAGQVRNAEPIIKFGRNLAVGTSEEMLWTGGGQYPFLDAAEFLNVASTDALDANLSTGAWTMTIEGLDENWAHQMEDVILDGQNVVQTTKKFRRAFRGWIKTGGSLSGQIGDIVITSAVTASLQMHLIPEHNQTLMAIYTVPADHYAIILGINGSVAKADQAAIRSYFKPNDVPNTVKRCARTFDLYQQYGGTNFPIGYAMPPKSDVWMAAEAKLSTVSVSAAWYMVLIPAGYVNTVSTHSTY